MLYKVTQRNLASACLALNSEECIVHARRNEYVCYIRFKYVPIICKNISHRYILNVFYASTKKRENNCDLYVPILNMKFRE